MADDTPDYKEQLDMVEKAQAVDQSEIDVAADDSGLSALVQKAAVAEEREKDAER